jgi:tRNA-dihydrouridine synthase B
MNEQKDSKEEFAIGTLHLQSKYLLAPMEGVSDVGFRRLCYAQGAGITWTEMVRASGVMRKNKATLDLIDTFDAETPTGLQLFVANERELFAALRIIDELAASTHPHFNNIIAVDLNFGCPSPELIRIGAGPALMKRAAKMETIFKMLHDWKQTTKLPIGACGAKIRLGMNAQEQEYKVYLRLIPAANKYLDYLIVHARHAKQKSSDAPTWSAIAEIKAQCTIPVIGNGNVFNKEDAERMFSTTNCDGIMIARGAIRNPWVFKELIGKVVVENDRNENKKNENEEEMRRIISGAEEEYFELAKKFSTKEKYLVFHKDNFKKIKENVKL